MLRQVQMIELNVFSEQDSVDLNILSRIEGQKEKDKYRFLKKKPIQVTWEYETSHRIKKINIYIISLYTVALMRLGFLRVKLKLAFCSSSYFFFSSSYYSFDLEGSTDNLYKQNAEQPNP